MVLFIFGIITNNYRSLQINAIATYKQIDKKIELRDSLMNQRLPEIKDVLVKTYPQFEKEVFALISAKDIQWFWSKYPEIKSIQAVSRYVDELNEYSLWVQGKKEEQLDIKATLEAQKKTPYAFNFLIPTLQDDD